MLHFGAAADALAGALEAIRTRRGDLGGKLELLSDAMHDVGRGLDDCGFKRASELIGDVFRTLAHGRPPADADADRNIFIRGVDVTKHLAAAAEA